MDWLLQATLLTIAVTVVCCNGLFGVQEELQPYQSGFDGYGLFGKKEEILPYDPLEKYRKGEGTKDDKSFIVGEFTFGTEKGISTLVVLATDEKGIFKVLDVKKNSITFRKPDIGEDTIKIHRKRGYNDLGNPNRNLEGSGYNGQPGQLNLNGYQQQNGGPTLLDYTRTPNELGQPGNHGGFEQQRYPAQADRSTLDNKAYPERNTKPEREYLPPDGRQNNQQGQRPDSGFSGRPGNPGQIYDQRDGSTKPQRGDIGQINELGGRPNSVVSGRTENTDRREGNIIPQRGYLPPDGRQISQQNQRPNYEFSRRSGSPGQKYDLREYGIPAGARFHGETEYQTRPGAQGYRGEKQSITYGVPDGTGYRGVDYQRGSGGQRYDQKLPVEYGVPERSNYRVGIQRQRGPGGEQTQTNQAFRNFQQQRGRPLQDSRRQTGPNYAQDPRRPDDIRYPQESGRPGESRNPQQPDRSGFAGNSQAVVGVVQPVITNPLGLAKFPKTTNFNLTAVLTSAKSYTRTLDATFDD